MVYALLAYFIAHWMNNRVLICIISYVMSVIPILYSEWITELTSVYMVTYSTFTLRKYISEIFANNGNATGCILTASTSEPSTVTDPIRHVKHASTCRKTSMFWRYNVASSSMNLYECAFILRPIVRATCCGRASHRLWMSRYIAGKYMSSCASYSVWVFCDAVQISMEVFSTCSGIGGKCTYEKKIK